MGIGKMTQRVDIISINQTGTDEIGGQVVTKVKEATVWARVVQNGVVSTSDYMTSRTNTGYTKTLRAGSFNITTDNLIEWSGMTLKIDSITKDEKNRYTIVEAYSE